MTDLVNLNNLFESNCEISMEKSLNGRAQPDFNDFDAVINYVSRLDKLKKLSYKDFDYVINTYDPVEVSPQIFFELKPPQMDEKSQAPIKLQFRLFSDSLNINELKSFIAKCRQEYEAQRNNKLGSELYFFDQMPANDSRFSNALSFDKKHFVTSRTFDNVFFEEHDDVENRVNHYMNNKAWYSKRGIPYTLGFLFSGKPGTGKCLGKGTEVMMYNGSKVKVEDIRVGDLLMGDSIHPRQVLDIASGTDTLYKICNRYVVNSCHMLSLRIETVVAGDGTTFYYFKGNSWHTTDSPSLDWNYLHITGDIIDVALDEFLTWPPIVQSMVKGFRYGQVHHWPAVETTNDPYTIGRNFTDEFHKLTRGSFEQRMQLLDGFFHDSNTKKVSLFIAHVVEDLAQSVGFHTHYNGTELTLVRSPVYETITVEKLSQGDYYGFTLDGNGRFCLGDYTVTHNTSTIKAIANVTKRHIINVRLGEIKTNTQLKNLFFNPVLQIINPETLNVEKIIVPIHQRLYVIEDIDCMTDLVKRREGMSEDEELEAIARELNQPKKSVKVTDDGDEDLQDYYSNAIKEEKKDIEESDEEETDKITYDGLINLIDGTLENPGRMLIITTNRKKYLDPALIRPGRIDMIIEFKYANKSIVKKMFESFYDKEFSEEMFSKLEDYKVSPAVVNQLLFKHFSNPEKAIQELLQ